MNKKSYFLLFLTLLISVMFACSNDKADNGKGGEEVPPEVIPPTTVPLETPYVISIGGNAYVTKTEGGAQVTDQGITNWTNANTVISVYFKTSAAGTLNLALEGASMSGTSKIKISVADSVFYTNLDKTSKSVFQAGQVVLPQAGYVKVDIQGVSNNGGYFGSISAVKIGGDAVSKGKITCVENFENYWGRRGPSVHMGYQMPTGQYEYFYNEVTVPENNDVMNSYFMTNGFGEGYMGIQVNSSVERRILFSVWSPYDTDDPGSIPEDQKIKLLRQGKDVKVNDFGNEGSGAQSYLIYPWKAGVTYKFLTKVEPDGNGNTDYTAYFYATDQDEWRLIASFKRPKTTTDYTNPHSFLENFNPDMGYVTREVYFDNQWIRSTDGVWEEMTQGTFTHDATANAGVRMDFTGGVKDGKFFLKNCGFFNETTKGYTTFTRTAKGVAPKINFTALENIPSIK